MVECTTVTVGLDVHARSIRLAAVRADELLEERTLPYDAEAVERLLRRWPTVRCCYEAGRTGFGLYRHLVGRAGRPRPGPSGCAASPAGDVAEPRLVGGGADGRGQAGPGAKVAGRAETADLADLCDQQHRRVGIPRSRVNTSTRGSCRACASISPFACSISRSKSSIKPSRLPRRRRAGSRSGSLARKRRPPAPNRSAWPCWIL
jgi:hypothetical protein